MKRKTIAGLIAIVAIVAIAMFAGCVEEEESKQMELLATAVSGNVISIPTNLDADAEIDGISIFPGLMNESRKSVRFEGIELPVEIKIYTAKYDENYNEIRDRLVYSGTGIIDSWRDFHPFYGGESINILFEDIKTINSDDDYGWVYATITLPDGRTIEAVDKGARIKPTGQAEKVTEESKQMELLATAVSGNVISIPTNLDADAEIDGISIFPGLMNESRKSVRFEGIELPVEIKIYTAKYDENYNEIRDRLVYSGTGIIDSWRDFHPFYGGESINILFEDIKTINSDDDYGPAYDTVTLPDGGTMEIPKPIPPAHIDDYGWVYATITLPDGRTIEAVDKGARIKPE